MATVREHFDTTAKALNAQSEWKVQKQDKSNPVVVIGKISYCQEENAKYWSFFFPENYEPSYVGYILNMPNVPQCIISEDEPSQEIGFADKPERQTLDSFKFTGRIYLYIDESLSNERKQEIINFGSPFGFNVIIRDREYVKTCSELSKPLAFISHDSRDKDSLVRQLAFEMSKLLCTVWYDEFSLKVGDSLRENIEKGLKDSKKCIVVLSPDFLSNGGWSKAEFDSIYTREIHEENNIILPVWHNVGKNEVYEYCPRLADRFALSSSVGTETLAKKLVAAINA
jgi:hypothetical protein